MPIGYFCFMKIFWKYAPTVQEDIHALVHCNFNETKPQVFFKLDAYFNNTFFKEHLCEAAFEKCYNHSQLQRHFSTLEDIV